MLQLMQDVIKMSLDKFQADVLATKSQYERSDAFPGGGIDAILLIYMLHEGLQETHRELRQRHQEIVDWFSVGTIRDVWP